jgi:hypothetical protein
MKSDQFYNHFPHSRELGSKQGLNTHLNGATTGDVYKFYPRGYDLSEYRQVELFLEDFHRTAVLNCLKKHAKYFEKLCGDKLREIEYQDKRILSNCFQKERKRNLKRAYVGLFPENRDEVGDVNTILLRIAIFFAHNLLLLSQDCDGTEFIKHDFFKCTYSFPPKLLHKVVAYSHVNLPIKSFRE